MCSPGSARKVDKDKKFYHRTRQRGDVTVEIAARRALEAEIGPEGVRPEQSSGLAQKYGVVPTRLDRKVNRRNWTKPSWVSSTEWKRRQTLWLDWTRGLVERYQVNNGPNSRKPSGENLRKPSGSVSYSPRPGQAFARKVDVPMHLRNNTPRGGGVPKKW